MSIVHISHFRVPADMLHARKETEKKFSGSYDQHGDSYFEKTTSEQLRKVFNKIDEMVCVT